MLKFVSLEINYYCTAQWLLSFKIYAKKNNITNN